MTELQCKRCGDILRHYGAPEQRRQLMEECAELIQAVSKLHRATPETSIHAFYNFVEELADVEIMVEQMKQTLTPEELDRLGQIETAKINRQLRRIAFEELNYE